jgi:hypothetical protein
MDAVEEKGDDKTEGKNHRESMRCHQDQILVGHLMHKEAR